MLKKTGVKQTALLLTLVYFFLPSHIYMMINMERHALGHMYDASSATQHVSSACTLMCGTSTFAHQANPNLSQSSDPAFDNLVAYSEPFSGNLSVLYFRDRSPPVLLS